MSKWRDILVFIMPNVFKMTVQNGFSHREKPSGNFQDTVAMLRFFPGTFRTLSQHCDSFPKLSGSCRNAAILSGNFQDTVATLRFFPGTFRTLSQCCDSFWKLFGHCRNAAILSGNFQDAVATLRFFPETFRDVLTNIRFILKILLII
jgi:hypothetical protein